MLYDATPDYAHSLEVRDPRRLLFVSGTMGLDATGNAPATLKEQLVLVWDNLRAILADGEHDDRPRRAGHELPARRRLRRSATRPPASPR